MEENYEKPRTVCNANARGLIRSVIFGLPLKERSESYSVTVTFLRLRGASTLSPFALPMLSASSDAATP